MWCLIQRRELAILNGTYMTKQMKCYLDFTIYVYPKKWKQLEDIVTHQKECLSISEGGVRTVRDCGSQWICHKWAASCMKWILANSGAYTNHLVTLSEDASIRPADRSTCKLNGYTTSNRWMLSMYRGVQSFVTFLLIVKFVQRSCNMTTQTHFRPLPLSYKP